ncbi:hypothetical protein N9L76_03870 [bacterium]|jgi:hypothetical protein|nr:hypothetical protein [bacterium]|tara:strand:+ start:22291 stop:23109 length:819 start_codon:yes stop_codon:yes gene_type:complete
MGASAKEPVEAVVDPRAAPRQSLLEVTYERLDAKGVGARGVNDLPARVVLLCENETRLESIEMSSKFWPRLFQESASSAENVASAKSVTHTGAALVYPDATLVTIESKGGEIIGVLRALEEISLATCDKTPDNSSETEFPFVSIRVCASVEDSKSVFPGWYTGFVQALALDDGYEPAEDGRLLKIASKANIACVELGLQLGEDEKSWKQKLDALVALEPDDPFPTCQQLMGVLRNTEQGPPTLTEFLDVYHAPLDVDLDSENVWPAPPPLQF